MRFRKAGLWLGNGNPQRKDLMLSWQPDTVMSIYDYIGYNGVVDYKRDNPDVTVIIRFMHPLNWMDDINTSATNSARELIGKWESDAVLRELKPLFDVMNEPNLHYECNDPNPGNQWMYEDKPHYQSIANWFGTFAEIVKDSHPEIRLLSPALAYGHNEDGEASLETGEPKIGWAGYDYIAPLVQQYCDGVLNAHFYWGNSGGSVKEWLYDEDISSWHAFRWWRVLTLFKKRYGFTPKILITEAGNFAPGDADFSDQIEYYTRETLKNPNIAGIVYFLWDDPTHSPGNEINSWVAKCRDLDAHVERMNNLIVTVDEQPEDGTNMWWQDFTARAQAHYDATGEPLNEAADYGVTIETVTPDTEKKLQCLGVYHLSGDDNRGNHNFYFDGLSDTGARLYDYYLEITDNGGNKTYPAIEKPENEPGGNAPLFKDVTISAKVLSMDDEFPSDTIRGITSGHPDENEWNTWWHHSFFAVWKIVTVGVTKPPSEPTPPPSEPVPAQGWFCKLLKVLCEVFCGSSK